MTKQTFDSEEAMEDAFEEEMNQLQAEEIERQNEEIEMDSEWYEPIHNPHKYAAIAKQWLDDNPLFLDTETTGLDNDAEVVEISVIDSSGQSLLDTLVKPVFPIPKDAIAIHGITNEMVEDAPIWPEIHEQFCQIIQDRTLLIYNLDYDLKILKQTISFHDFNKRNSLHKLPDFLEICRCNKHCCVMKLYAAFYGQWDDYREDWKWKKLTAAADYMGVQIEGKAHRALADCQMTLGVLKAMVDTLPETPETKVQKHATS